MGRRCPVFFLQINQRGYCPKAPQQVALFDVQVGADVEVAEGVELGGALSVFLRKPDFILPEEVVAVPRKKASLFGFGRKFLRKAG